MTPFFLSGAARRSRGVLAALMFAAGLVPMAGALAQTSYTVTGMDAAENSIQTTTGRIFVSSKTGVYELGTSGTAGTKRLVPTQFKNGVARPCYFLGMAEWTRTLYSVCTEDSSKAAAPKYLMALDLNSTDPTTPLREIATLRAEGLPNGLASDGRGNLYLANLATFAPGNLWRLSLAGRFAVALQSPVYQFPNLNPNGVKFHGGQLYVTANPPLLVGTSALLRFPVTFTGVIGEPVTLYTSNRFLDDVGLVKDGLLLASFLGNQVLHLSETGQVLHAATLYLPTSATYVKNNLLPSGGLLVTLGGSDQAVIGDVPWGLAPR